MESYNEYLDRAKWNRSERLQQFVANQILWNFARDSNMSKCTERVKVFEIGSGVGRGAIAVANYFDADYE